MTLKSIKQSSARQLNPNHTEVIIDDACLLYSYGTLVAFTKGNQVYLTSSWDYSRTTLKYLGQFLGANTATIRTRIASGQYKVV